MSWYAYRLRLTCIPARRDIAMPVVKIPAKENNRSQPDPVNSLPPQSWDVISMCRKPMKHTILDSPTSTDISSVVHKEDNHLL